MVLPHIRHLKMLSASFILLSLCLAGKSFAGLAEETALLPLTSRIQSLLERSKNVSPDLKIVHHYYSQKKAEAFTRTGDFLPQAYLNFKKTKDFYEERNAPLRALGIYTYDSSWGIDYNWTLFNYGLVQNARKTLTEKDKALIEVESKEKSYPVSFNTNLLNYLLAKYKNAAVLNSLKKAEAQKKEAQLGFELGQKTRLDVLRSEANMVSLSSKKISYADEEQNTKSKFLEFSGLEERDLDFLENLSEEQILALINSISSARAIKEVPLFEKSPVLQGLGFEEKINNISLHSLTAKEWPELKIQGSYTASASSWDKSFHEPYRTHSIALVLSIPLFNSGSLISSNFEQYHALKQNNYSFAQKTLETKNQLNNTLIKIKALETLVSSLALNVTQYEELYRLTSKSYQLGKSTLLELLEVQDNLLDSKIALAQNKIQYYTLSQNYLWQAGLQ
jgi:outer membrane protein TolC